ncbi:hypothetical protein NA78x_001805 [Anatilimnocola sp. NA78]|uniref:hypothetical protein n=1 Tax=Anatilimnocola sp. NA78 TaxID=3415683 RepID=UPI003CE4B0AB
MASLLKRDRREIAGRLMELWEWCDDNLSEADFEPNGDASLTIGDNAFEFLDEIVALPGFAAAMASPNVRWLIASENGRLTFPHLARNNGITAKSRLYESARKSKQRNSLSQNSRDNAGTETGTREEKSERREEKISNRDRTDRPIVHLSDQSPLEIFRKQRQEPDELSAPVGEPMDLSSVDWFQVIRLTECLAKKVPPFSKADRRQWFRFAVMVERNIFSEHWLIDAAEAVVNAPQHAKNRQAHLVAVLKSKAAEQGICTDDFLGIARRIEIPADVWNQPIVKVKK